MQKKLIALAIAGLASAPVFAQSNVTVYGVVDATVESVQAKGGNAADIERRTRVTSNSSLIGFRGTEDLGNGLKALFQVESGFNADGSGTSTLATRDTFVGLTGGFGTVQLGKLTTFMRQAGAKVDFNPAATGIGFQAATYGTIGGIKTGVDERINNAVMYTSPNFSGFAAQLAYSAGENKLDRTAPAEDVNANAYQLAAAYENGPLYVSAGYALSKDPSAAANPGNGNFAGTFGLGGNASDKLKTARVAAKYTFPTNTSISALWDQTKYEADLSIASTEAKRTAWMVGAEQKFAGNQAVYLQYSRSQKIKEEVCVDGIGCADLDGKTQFAQWTLGYTYSLSKRTMVKAYYTRINNQRESNVDFYLSSIGGVRADQDPTGFGLGLRHTF
ncbi:porin [Aromatoleum toluvorans]|uniref:Porin n=1 Tax=Aromatoleum toluvorans TaxID=92002 RepID=A0ABX1Q0F5_9RHOO|nr:porin [Aromatoleum toluvorans]NMG44920.1 porin [Aromatoleum toluvorans]